MVLPLDGRSRVRVQPQVEPTLDERKRAHLLTLEREEVSPEKLEDQPVAIGRKIREDTCESASASTSLPSVPSPPSPRQTAFPTLPTPPENEPEYKR